eukprot:248017-Lingulodinium_polyedra.AAC.1
MATLLATPTWLRAQRPAGPPARGPRERAERAIPHALLRTTGKADLPRAESRCSLAQGGQYPAPLAR